MRTPSRPPVWFILLVVIALLPIGSTPMFIGLCPEGDGMMQFFAWCFPLVILMSAVYALKSYYTRQVLAWVMWAFMVLIDLSMFWLFMMKP